MLEKGIAFGIMSMLTFHLTKDEMGYVGLFVFTCALMQTFIGLGTDNYVRLCVVKKQEKINDILSSVFFILLCSSIFYLLLMVLNDRFSFYILLQKKHYYLIFVYSFTSTIVSIFLCLNQGQKKVIRYSLVAILKVTFDLLVLLSLLRFSLIDSETRLLSLIVSNITICFISLFYLFKEFYKGFHFRKELKETFLFISKALPNTIVVASILVIDKIIIGNKSTSLLGELTFLAAVASPILFFCEALNKASLPYSFEYLKSSKYLYYDKMNIKNLYLLVFVSIIYYLSIKLTAHLLFSENYLYIINYLSIFMFIPFFKLLYYSFARVFTFNESLQKLLYINLPIGLIYIYVIQLNIELSLLEVINYILLYQFLLATFVFLYSRQYFKSNFFRISIHRDVFADLRNSFTKT